MDIATISYLPQPQRDIVKRVQKIISKRFDTYAALDWTPHITIADRVIIPEYRLSAVAKRVREICKDTKPIKIYTAGLFAGKIDSSPFESSYLIVVFLLPNLTLNGLNAKISNILSRFKKPSIKSKNYYPHITLSYKDLSASNFEKAKAYLEEHPIELEPFEIDNVHFDTFDGKKWKSFKKFNLRA